ncbi:MAG: hypothetical protein WC804_02395 [Sphingomonas sp.]|uniref:hypothetical protein n=1 Tax=Sphingomonas sp. TaxID=28214 RepID=UPI0035686EB2
MIGRRGPLQRRSGPDTGANIIDSEIAATTSFRLAGINLPRWLVLTLVALAARAMTFGNPVLHVDEQFYYAVADAMRHGALPFVDVWDRKPVGLFLVYLPATLLGPVLGIWAYQALALACVVLTAVLIVQLADRAGWGRGALVGAILYILWLNITDGQGGQSPVFYNPLVAAAMLLVLPRPGEAFRPRAIGVAAMALIGLSLQIKYSTVFEGIWIGLILLWREWRAGRALGSVLAYGVALVLVALLPTLAAAGVYAALGHEQAFLYANFISVLRRRPDSWQESGGNFVLLVLSILPLIAAAWAGRHIGAGDAERQDVRRFLRGWLLAAIFGVLLFGSYFNHYALPLLVPGCVCAAAWFGESPRGRRAGWVLAAIVALVGQAIVIDDIHKRGSTAELRALAAAIGPGPGCLYVFSGDTMLYPATGRCAESAYLFPSHLDQEREQGAIGVDQVTEIRRIFARRPAVVVMRPPYPGERSEMRALAVRLLAEGGYRLTATRPLGTQRIEIFTR